MSHTTEASQPTSLLLNSLIRLTKSLLPNRQIDPLSFSSQQCASWRAMETNSLHPLITDPYAEALAGPVAMSRARKMGQLRYPRISVRTRYFDEFATNALVDRTQMVLLGAGMDMRAYRLSAVTENTRVFEVDVETVINLKLQLLGNVRPPPKPRGILTRVGADVTGDWGSKLCSMGFRSGQRTVWLVEGLVYYLEQEHVDKVFRQISQLSGSGSVICFSAVTRLSEGRKGLAAMFKTSMPDARGYLKRFGFETEHIAELGGPDANYGRWPLGEKQGKQVSTIYVTAFKQ